MSLFPQFENLPDPWPGLEATQNDVPPLSNVALKEAYTERYGQAPGNPSADELQRMVPGWMDENFDKNYLALRNACDAGVFGPERVGKPISYTETVDCAFANPKNSGFYREWWWEKIEGGSPKNPVHVSDPTRPHGAFTTHDGGGQGWTVYYFNDVEPRKVTPPASGANLEPIPERIAETLRMAPNWAVLGPGRAARLAEVQRFFEHVAGVVRG